RDQHAHPRIRREVPVLDPALRAVDDDLVAVEQIPHDREVRRAVWILRADDDEALLLEEIALSRGELGDHYRNMSRAAGRTYSCAVSSESSNVSPRTMATGQRSSFPMTSSAAAAISSATAISVTRSSYPSGSRCPMYRLSAGRPAMPIATFV